MAYRGLIAFRLDLLLLLFLFLNVDDLGSNFRAHALYVDCKNRTALVYLLFHAHSAEVV